ncbi:MAG: PAS domain S-box protein [Planctomycetes bacterium]|jgi:PAS domain S-box-containing protein|nr:PAS domain S-box protein [Planctomycetota bacterium]
MPSERSGADRTSRQAGHASAATGSRPTDEAGAEGYRQLVSTLREGIWRINAEGRTTFVNEAMADMLGYSVAEMQGTQFLDYMDDANRAHAEALFARRRESAAEQHQFVFRHSDGRDVAVLVSASPVTDEAGQFAGALAAVVDITEHKATEAALRESETLFRTTFEQAAVGMAIVAPDGAIQEANARFCEIVGYTQDELRGLSYEEFTHPDDLHVDKREVERVMTGEIDSFDIEKRYTHKDGHPVWVHLHSNVVRDDAGRPRYAICAVTNISDQKQAEEAAAHRIAIERALQQVSRVLLVQADPCRALGKALDLLREVSDAKRVYIVENCEDVQDGLCMRQTHETCASGVEPKIGSVQLQTLPYKAGFMRWLERLSQGEAIVGTIDEFPAAERDILAPQGILSLLVVPIFVNNALWGFLGFDDTEQPRRWSEEDVRLLMLAAELIGALLARQKTEAALRDSERRHRELFTGSRDGLVMVDAAGHIVDANEAYCRMLGYSIEELRAMENFYEITPETWRAWEAEEIWRNRLLKQGYSGIYRKEYIRKDGTVFPVELQSYAVFDDGGEIWYLWGVARDITERVRAEEERTRLEEQYRQAQKLEAVGRLAGGVAHDFNNQLQAILGFADIVLGEPDLPDDIADSIGEIRKAAARSADLTRQLLAFARKQTVCPKVLDLNETVGRMLQMLRRLIGEDIQLQWSPGKALGPVRIDPGQVNQILANLCVNASDAIDGVGHVDIATTSVRIAPEDADGTTDRSPGDYVCLSVTDDGAGMDAEVQGQIFEPFFTTKDPGRGTGLGLATVYGIVRQNGGFVDVSSEPGRGTTLCIYLPGHDGHAASPRDRSSTTSARRGHETVLFVEDEPAVLRLGRALLDDLGYNILAASTPGEAIRLAREHAGPIDLLITDVIMPEMNGRDLARELLSLHPNMRRLFMSGYTANVIAHHGVLEDGVHFLQKPFTRDALAASVREAFDEN